MPPGEAKRARQVGTAGRRPTLAPLGWGRSVQALVPVKSAESPRDHTMAGRRGKMPAECGPGGARKPRRSRLRVRENVLPGPARKVEANAIRQETEARLGKVGAPLAREQDIELLF